MVETAATRERRSAGQLARWERTRIERRRQREVDAALIPRTLATPCRDCGRLCVDLRRHAPHCPGRA